MDNQKELPSYDLKDVEIDEIDFGDRVRKDMGDISSLATDIQDHGVLTPILVADKEQLDRPITSHDDLDPDRKYLLIAGERRTRAAIKADRDVMPAKVFHRQLDEWESRVMELHENIYRKSMTPYEEAQAKKQMHELYQERYGVADTSGKGGHTQTDTAEMLDQDIGTISRDLEIAEWGEKFEDIRDASTKKEARRKIKKKKKEIAAKEKERRIEEQEQEEEESGEVEIEGADETRKMQKNLAERYQLGNYFSMIEQLPDRSIDILELDPDWGIDFIERRSGKTATDHDAAYKSIDPEAYEDTFREILHAAWPKLKDHSWVLTWYSIEEWHQETYQILEDVGFKVSKMPAFWVKQTGNTATPAFRLGDCVGAFYYARKGTPRIQNMGRDNTFEYRTLKRNEREHPAEKPVELYQDILDTFGKRGQVVVSGFAGSGNCLLAAENLKMNSVGFDTEEENKRNFKIKAFDGEPGNYSSYRA